MTDYGEEQRNELEALESIYPDSFTGDFGGWGGGPGRAALPPALLPGLSIQFPAPCPAPFRTVLKSEGPGGPAEALEPSRALWFRVTAATRESPKHAETNSWSALSFARAAEGFFLFLFFLFSVLPSCGAAAG